jgi:hypothetical protein
MDLTPDKPSLAQNSRFDRTFHPVAGILGKIRSIHPIAAA